MGWGKRRRKFDCFFIFIFRGVGGGGERVGQESNLNVWWQGRNLNVWWGGGRKFRLKKIVVFMLHVILIWCYVSRVIPVKYILSA